MAGNRARALKSYDKAHAWKELFTLAKLEKLPEEEMQDLVQRIASTFLKLYQTDLICC